MSVADDVYRQALVSLQRCCTPDGVKASAGKTGHTQVWTRDAMIALPGGWLSGDDTIRRALLASLDLLRSKQAETGAIPNNVDSQSFRPNFRAYADAGLWWIVGSSIISPDPSTVDRILAWY